MTEEPRIAGTRTYQHHHLDSTRWGHVTSRPDDIIVSTPYKCGTTWTQRILAALLHGPATLMSRELSPWVDARFWGPVEEIAVSLEAQPHRRFMKSHLPLDGLAWHDDTSYVILGRDPRDIFMSLLNHYDAYSDVAFAEVNDEGNPGETLPKYDGDLHALWRAWIGRGWFEWEEDGWPFWSAFHHLSTWWSVRDQPNVFLLHYADMKADPTGEIGRLASFLGIEVTPVELAAVVEVTSFDRMRQEFIDEEAASGGSDGGFFEGGVARFIFKGTNGRWRDVLTQDDLALYEQRAARLDPALRAWLEQGARGDR